MAEFARLVCLLTAWASAYGGRVLISPSTLHPAHRFVLRDLAAELVDRGHEVVWWEIGLKHHDYIKLPAGVEERHWPAHLDEGYANNLFRDFNTSIYDHLYSERVFDVSLPASNWMVSLRMCEHILSTRRADFDALVAEKFDTEIIDDLYNPCGLLHASLTKSVYVYWSFTPMRTETAWATHSPSPASYVPAQGSNLSDDLDLMQRAYNLAVYVKNIYIHQKIVQRRMDAALKRHYADIPDTFYMERNASLNFINTPPVFDFPRAFMPRVNFVGGLHCRKAKPLTGAVGTFVAAHKTVFLVSTGFTVHWQRIPTDVVNRFVEAFRSRPEVGFVWQYDGPAIKNAPANLHTAKWVPQQDILGHAHTKGFVTHGGLLSCIEAMYHGVPVVGLPVLNGHIDYLKRVTERGAGFILHKRHFTADTLALSVDKLLDNAQYTVNATEFQEMLLDVPYTELNHSAFWVEFIMRHQEIPHARSGADDLNIFQYFLLDVLAFLFACASFVGVILFYCLKGVARVCCRAKTPADAAKKTN